MKRIPIAAIIAVGMHVLILSMEFDWINGKSHGRSESRIVTMTLVTRQPGRSELKTVVNKRTLKKRTAKPKRQKNIERSPEAATDDKKKKSEATEFNAKADKIQQELMEKPDDLATEQAVGILGTGAEELKPMMEAIPIYDKNPPPEYPLIARRRGLQGNVVLEVMVDRNGSVTDLKVFKSSGYKVLDRAAEKSVRQWIFKPAIRGNEKIEIWVRVPICFQLSTDH